jgi:hypothetical protein
MQDAKAELDAQLAEVRVARHPPPTDDADVKFCHLARLQVREGLRESAAACTDGNGAALALITTFEGQSVVLRLDEHGVRIDGTTNDGAAPAVYDCVNSLLLNTSAGFVAHFNSSLARALARVAEERAQEEVVEEEKVPER